MRPKYLYTKYIALRCLLNSAMRRLNLIMKHLHLKQHQSQPMLTALALMSILSLGSSITFVHAAAASPADNSQGIANLKQSRSNKLPNSVVNAIRRDLARRTDSARGQWRVVSFSQQNWPNGCLGLSKPDEACTQMIIENGWRVVMSNGRQTLTYRTDATGRLVRLEGKKISDLPTSDIPPTSSNLPSSVANTVLQEASRQLRVPTSQLRIAQAQQQTWTNSCLDLQSPVERCMGVQTAGWRVAVAGGSMPLVFHTNEDGSTLRLNKQFSMSGSADVPQPVAEAVLQAASQRTGLRASELRIILSQQIMGSSSCLGLPPRAGEGCTRDLAPIWLVVVEGGQQRLLYHTNQDGSRVRLNEATANIGDAKSPDPIAEKPTSPGNRPGVPIPSNELPPPLPQDAMFRVITSGGIMGRTEETTLLNNGQLVRKLIGPNGTASTPEVTTISPERVEQFKRLLSMQSMGQFNGQSFPAPRGAADYMTVTLTSQDGTFRYADIAQDQLPKPLQVVMLNWDVITKNR